GALENWPDVIEEAHTWRWLWGNEAGAVRRSRDPSFLAGVLRRSGIPHPAAREWLTEEDRLGRGAIKPPGGRGGAGRRARREACRYRSQEGKYFQEYVEGESCAALYLGHGRDAVLLGLTRQLTGEPWLHAAPFHYCGSIGPLRAESTTATRLVELGRAVAAGC